MTFKDMVNQRAARPQANWDAGALVQCYRVAVGWALDRIALMAANLRTASGGKTLARQTKDVPPSQRAPDVKHITEIGSSACYRLHYCTVSNHSDVYSNL
jgi:hypothetical protein